MNAPSRNFEAKDGKREHTPLLIGLTGPSGGGKTFSAFRLATGIQSVVGGDIYMIDTENRRGLHYADRFTFKHVDMQPPFGSLDYLAAMEFCVANGAKTIIVDSMSHEHEGEGGLLSLHEKELDRLAGNDWAKRERVKMLAWSEPKQRRRQLLNGMLRLNANLICCFRAKPTAKPVKKDGKTEVEQLGFMPIAGDEFVFEMTLNCLLPPAAAGVPKWQSEETGEQMMIKLPEQFRTWLLDKRQPLDEAVGAGLARWASGVEKPAKAEPEPELLP